jgi:hypothetical protein
MQLGNKTKCLSEAAKEASNTQKPRQQTIIIFNDTLILTKLASNANQQHGLNHQRDATPTHTDAE